MARRLRSLNPLLLASTLYVVIAGSGLFLLNLTLGTANYVASIYIVVFISVLGFLLAARMVERKRRELSLILFLTILLIALLRFVPKYTNLAYGYVMTPGDEGYEFSTILITLRNDRLVYEQINRHNYEYIQFPLIHILSSIYINIAEVNPLIVTFIIPILSSWLVYLVLYTLFVKPVADVSKSSTRITIMPLNILLLTFLFSGYHGVFWSFMVRETYTLPFAIITFLTISGLTSSSDKYFKILPIVIITVVLGHFATRYFLVVALLLSFLVSKLSNILTRKRLAWFTALVVGVALYDLYQMFIALGFVNWMKSIYREFVEYYPEIITSVPVTSIGTELPWFESGIIILSYIALFVELVLFSFIQTFISKNFKLFITSTVIILTYFGSLMGRFLPGHPRHAFMRFSSWVLLIFILLYFISIQIGVHHRNKGKTIDMLIYILPILFIFVLLGYIAQTSPILKGYVTTQNPVATVRFIEMYMQGSYVYMAWLSSKPYSPPYLEYSLLDSYIVNLANRPTEVLLQNGTFKPMREAPRVLIVGNNFYASYLTVNTKTDKVYESGFYTLFVVV